MYGKVKYREKEMKNLIPIQHPEEEEKSQVSEGVSRRKRKKIKKEKMRFVCTCKLIGAVLAVDEFLCGVSWRDLIRRRMNI